MTPKQKSEAKSPKVEKGLAEDLRTLSKKEEMFPCPKAVEAGFGGGGEDCRFAWTPYLFKERDKCLLFGGGKRRTPWDL